MPLAVYVHFPWCLQKCPYCDFATDAIAPRDLEHARYANAVIAELALRHDAFTHESLGTVFFGGGTPSLWEPSELTRVLAAITARFGASDEVTVECNPTSLDRDRIAALRDGGVTRLSIGVQSLRDAHLRYLGRLHDASQAVRAIETAVASDMRVNADLMFGMPDQRADELLGDAARLLDLGVGHVSAYALTIEPTTRFGELARKGRLPRLPDDDVATLYQRLEQRFDEAGFTHYEVSNFARPGDEARHNLAYWRGHPYLGLGAAAVGCAYTSAGSAVRYRNESASERYMSSSGGLPPHESEALDGATLVREGLMLGLRTHEGVDLASLAARANCDPRAGRDEAIRREVARGNVIDDGRTLRIPRDRWLLADGIVSTLF